MIEDMYSQVVGVNNGRVFRGFESIIKVCMDVRKLHYGKEEEGIITEAKLS